MGTPQMRERYFNRVFGRVHSPVVVRVVVDVVLGFGRHGVYLNHKSMTIQQREDVSAGLLMLITEMLRLSLLGH